MKARKYGLSTAEQQEICLKASVNIRTLKKAIRGDFVQPQIRKRIERELKRRGKSDLLAAASSSPAAA